MFPFNGKLYPSPRKKYRELVFFVHFFGGNQKALKRHIEFVNTLGFDAFAFDLADGSVLKPPMASGGFGLKHLYADQIEELLNELPGQKIVYAFSNPAASAIEAMARRGCADVKALIADSGPSARFFQSTLNLYAAKKNPRNVLLRWASAPVLAALWSPKLHSDLPGQLEKFPKNFPVLSIRGWKDPVIPADHIDGVFEPHPDLDWRQLALPDAGHLNGLRDFRGEYAPTVAQFLEETTTPL